jgi:hypothetical protein
MKRVYKILLSVLIISFYMLDSSCQNKKEPGNNGDQMKITFANPDSAAATSVVVLQTLASDEKLKGTINLTPDEAKQLVIGKAIPVQEISYNDLLKDRPDSAILSPSADSALQKKWLYPLQVNNSTKTTAIVTKNDASWKLTSAGNNSYVEVLSSQRPAGASVVSVIEVPGLNVLFLRCVADGRFLYIPSRTIPEVKIEKGQLIPERELLQSLLTYARQVEEKNGKDIKNKKIVD